MHCPSLTAMMEPLEMMLSPPLMTAMQPALGKVSSLRVRVSDIPSHVMELVDAVNAQLSPPKLKRLPIAWKVPFKFSPRSP